MVSPSDIESEQSLCGYSLISVIFNLTGALARKEQNL